MEPGLILTQPDRRVGRLKSAWSTGQPHTLNCFRHAKSFIVALYWWAGRHVDMPLEFHSSSKRWIFKKDYRRAVSKFIKSLQSQFSWVSFWLWSCPHFPSTFPASPKLPGLPIFLQDCVPGSLFWRRSFCSSLRPHPCHPGLRTVFDFLHFSERLSQREPWQPAGLLYSKSLIISLLTWVFSKTYFSLNLPTALFTPQTQ